MSSFSNDALDALLAESSAASVGSTAKTSPVRSASKSENTFVSFDDLEPVTESAFSSTAAGGGSIFCGGSDFHLSRKECIERTSFGVCRKRWFKFV